MPLEVAIVFDHDDGRPLRIARVRDLKLLGLVADAAIHEAENDALAHRTDLLGELQRMEVRKLRSVLAPILRSHESVLT